MKKTFTLTLLFVAFCSAIFAQSIIPVPNDSAAVSANVTDEFDPVDVHIHVINNYGQAATFSWLLKNYVAPASWELKLCDNNNCYDLLFGSETHVSLTVNAGDTMDMKFQYSPHCLNGSGTANITIYVTGDSAATSTVLNYKADLTTTCTTGVIEVGNKGLRLYPNPVKSVFTVTGLDNAGNLSFEVYDMKGAAVKSEVKSATNTSIDISIANLPRGVYVLKAFDKEGNIAGTSRLSKVD